MGAGLKRRRARTRESASRERCPPLNSVKDCFQTPWKATCPNPRSWAQHPSPLNPQATLPDQIDLATGYDFDIWESWEYEYQSRSKSIQVNQRQQSSQKCHCNPSRSSSNFKRGLDLQALSLIHPLRRLQLRIGVGQQGPKDGVEVLEKNMTSAHQRHLSAVRNLKLHNLRGQEFCT